MAQPFPSSNLRSKRVATAAAVTVDSFSIVPRTFFIKGYDSTYFSIDEVNARLTFKKQPASDSVTIIYRVFPYRLNAVYRRFTYDSVVNNFVSQQQVFRRSGSSAGNSLFDFGTMNYNGSFGRSLSFGNNQDVVVNSQFNLQLNGWLADSIQIAAAITDNNIPIQPEGTTQQLNEFDKVLLQFKKKQWELNLGDIDLRQNDLYFLNFYKRLQGVSYSNASSISKEVQNKIVVSGAIAKGKFTRNIFQGQEGNQGPYRLQGVNNELFFIVLAGTERVFVDGQMLQRGEDQDYVINYNTAEVTFTPRKMITKDSRIQVEFEYAERNYLNSMFYGQDQINVGQKLKINIAAYTNGDAKNSPVNQTLDTQQKQFLNNLGDSVQSAFYPTAAIDTFSAGKILYSIRDTVVNGSRRGIYVYSTNPDSAKYNLSFIEVGANKGNYIPDFNGANGKVYLWVSPQGGVPQGNFEPATFLVTPKRQQLVAVAATYDAGKKTIVNTELALSNYDVNTFSNKDKSDNTGFAGKFNFRRLSEISLHKVIPLQLQGGYEITQKNFRPIERIRSSEFYRDWGLDLLPAAAVEHLPYLSLQLSDNSGSYFRYTSSAYFRSDSYKGYRQSIQSSNNMLGWLVNTNFNYTSFSNNTLKGFFLRPTVDISKTLAQFHHYVTGFSYALEHNEVHAAVTDSVTPSSFAFTTLSAYLRSDPAKANKWGVTYFTRFNNLPDQKTLQRSDRSDNINLTADLLANPHRQLRINATYRQLRVSNTALTNLTPEKTVLARLEYSMNEFKGFITGNALYEAGAGQEQKRDYSYIEVPAGQGEYTWNDYNNDGIPQLNEFEVAIYRDQAKYIRIFAPSNEFVKANYTQLNYSIAINPRTLLKSRSGKQPPLLSRFNFQSTLQTGNKQLSNGTLRFNPFKDRNPEDTSLLTLNLISVNTLSFNRFSQKWGLDVIRSTNYNKSLLTYGFEDRTLKDWTFKGRLAPVRPLTFEFNQKISNTALATPKFNNRNYDIRIVQVEPRVTFTKSTNYRIATSYAYNTKSNNLQYGGEKSATKSFNIEAKYNAVNNTSLSGKVTYSTIDYTGAANSTVSYIMLDALLPGKNVLWNFDWVQRLGRNLELNFQYEGRKPSETRTIHIGRVAIRAIL